MAVMATAAIWGDGRLSWRFNASGPVRTEPMLHWDQAGRWWKMCRYRKIGCGMLRKITAADKVMEKYSWDSLDSTVLYVIFHHLPSLTITYHHVHPFMPCFESYQVISQNSQVLFGSGGGIFYALSERLGTANWEFDAKAPIYTSAAVHRGGDHHGWSNPKHDVFQGQTGRQVRVDDVLMIVNGVDEILWNPGGFVYFGCNDGMMYALDEMNGAVIWSYNAFSPIRSSKVPWCKVRKAHWPNSDPFNQVSRWSIWIGQNETYILGAQWKSVRNLLNKVDFISEFPITAYSQHIFSCAVCWMNSAQSHSLRLRPLMLGRSTLARKPGCCMPCRISRGRSPGNFNLMVPSFPPWCGIWAPKGTNSIRITGWNMLELPVVKKCEKWVVPRTTQLTQHL